MRGSGVTPKAVRTAPFRGSISRSPRKVGNLARLLRDGNFAGQKVAVDRMTAPPAVDPPWFGTCRADGGCMRVQVASPLTALVLSNSTQGANHSAGFKWCIDHENSIVYAKIADTPQRSIAFFQVVDDQTNHACRFLTHHWIDGDLVRVYKEDGLNCTLDWVQTPDNVTGVTNATLHA